VTTAATATAGKVTIMGKKGDELLNPKSTFNKCSDDEPIFVLRAQDALAHIVVRQWADLAATHLGKDSPKVTEAYALAESMEAWARDNEAKLPD
jgi:hypothetical protein